MYYSNKGDTKNALEQMNLFSQQDNYHYWIIILLELDPLIDNIKAQPEFRKILDNIEIKFWNYHNRIKATLDEKNLL